MRIGLAQMGIVRGDFEKNKENCVRFFEDAVGKGVELLVFPEMTLTGFDVKNPRLAELETLSLEFFEVMSRRYGMGVLFGYSGKGKEKLKNYMILMDSGHILMRYAKIHPFSMGAEGQLYEGGHDVVTAVFRGFPLSGVICYDLRFPEIFQAVSDKVRCIFVIANWPEVRISDWNILLRARAIENLCYVAGVNCSGQSGTLYYSGMSAVYGPDGQLIAGEMTGERLLVADLTEETVQRFRAERPFRADRRPEVYGKFYR